MKVGFQPAFGDYELFMPFVSYFLSPVSEVDLISNSQFPSSLFHRLSNTRSHIEISTTSIEEKLMVQFWGIQVYTRGRNSWDKREAIQHEGGR